MLDGFEAIIWIADAGLKQLQFLNRTEGTLLGHPIQDWMGQNFLLHCLEPMSRPALLSACRRARCTLHTQYLEHRLLTATGEPAWFRTELHPLGGVDSQWLVGLMVDVSGYQRAHQQLQRAQQRFHELVDSIEGIVWEAEPGAVRFTFVSRRAERLLGYPVEQWFEEPGFWQNHIHPDDRDWAVNYCHMQVTSGRSHEFEYRMLAADGRTIWVRDLVTVVSGDGRPLHLRGVMVDVTDHKQAQEQLRHSLSLLRATLNSTEDGILVVSLDGRVVSFNRRFLDLWRIPDFLVDGRQDEALVAFAAAQLRFPDAFMSKVRELYGRPESESTDLLEFNDGRVYLRVSRPQQMEGRIVGRVWSFRDITRRRQAELERDRLLTREREARMAAEASKRRAAFLAEAGHFLTSCLQSEPLERVLERMVSEFADWCAIYLQSEPGGQLRPTAFAHRTPALEERARRWLEGDVSPSSDVEPVLREQQTLRVTGFSSVPLASAPAESPAFWGQLELRDVILAPLVVRGSVLGLLSLGAREVRFGQEDLVLAEELASRCALALDNLRLFRNQQRALAQAEEARALLETFLRTAPVGLAFLDRELRYLDVNDALAAMNSVPRERTLGRRIHEIIPTLVLKMEPIFRGVLATGQPVVEHPVSGTTLAAPGRVHHWLASVYPVRQGEGEVIGVGVAVLDVTERKRVEEDRMRLLLEAQNALRVRDEFLSVASHELKTPLTPLILRLRMLKRSLERGEKLEPGWVDKALSHVEQLSQLVSGLLDVTQLETGQLELRKERLSLSRLVQALVFEYRRVSARHSVRLDTDERELHVEGDRVRLVEVLANLLDNAIKYSPEGGEVAVRLFERDGRAVLEVSDRGIGIPQEVQARLFERFARAENAPARQYGGLGLSLYVSRKIVEAHRGHIWVRSEVGRGSTLGIELPLSERAGQAASAFESAAPDGLH